jgi:hypothetical protein
LYIAYLDEFGHIGPYISKSHDIHNTHPVFGLGGIVLPENRVREFATWFYKLKSNLLAYEISRSGKHPARWEKKGSALLTAQNFRNYPEVGRAMNRILNTIAKMGGFVFYFGLGKYKLPEDSSSESLYAAVLRMAIQRLNEQCVAENTEFMLVLDESDPKFHRDVILKRATSTMFGQDYCKQLIEPPFQVRSHLYQTLQCADWICGLMGRLAAYQAEPIEFEEFKWAEDYFSNRIERVSRRSSIRTKERGLQLREKYAMRSTITAINRQTVTMITEFDLTEEVESAL